MLHSVDPITQNPGPRDSNLHTLYVYVWISLIAQLEYKLVQWNGLYNLKSTTKNWQYPGMHRCVAIYLVTHLH